MATRSTVVVTGATGLIGVPLTSRLRADGYAVVALTRDAARAARVLGPEVRCVEAGLEADGPWTAELRGAHAVVHLAGESIAGARWTSQYKQRIRDSRVESTATIVRAIAALPAAERPRVLVTASGIDLYPLADPSVGFEDDEIDESNPPGDTFLGRVCAHWEAEALEAEEVGVRVVRMRTGVVLAREGGALAKLRGVFAKFVGGPLGSGKQWFSWIHLDDAVAAYAQAVADERFRGAINLVAPETVRQRDFARAFGRAVGRPALVPTPALALRLAVPGLWEYLVGGRRAVPAALQRLGFTFARPTLAEALRDL